MFDMIKKWLRLGEASKHYTEGVYCWAEALRYDFPAHDDPGKEIRQQLSELVPEVDLSVLISTNENEDIRILAIVLAAVDSRADCHNALIAVLNDQLESVRRSAAIALLKMDTISGLAAVVAGHRHGHGIRTQAAYRLAEHGPAAVDAIPSLFALINYSDINWRSHTAASIALSAIGANASPYLTHALIHGSAQSKHESAFAMRENGVPKEFESTVNTILEPDN
ncbi:MAG: hypothetical protein COA78_05485 [Blastopirellula sp.]|nr:MAG: hypothetical protein COA78_05485 [Blastopirellula sp.]